jgi:hypothetical protein
LYSGGSGGKNVNAPATVPFEQPLWTHKQNNALIAGGQQQHMVDKRSLMVECFDFCWNSFLLGLDNTWGEW